MLTEDEVEYSLLNVLTIAKETLTSLPFTERRVDFLNWQAPLFEIQVGVLFSASLNQYSVLNLNPLIISVLETE